MVAAGKSSIGGGVLWWSLVRRWSGCSGSRRWFSSVQGSDEAMLSGARCGFKAGEVEEGS